ncbi:hypothetical protein GN958_ATG17578, partial [Phytophthora infestans]
PQLASNPRLKLPPDGYLVLLLNLTQATISCVLRQARRSDYISVFREVGGEEDEANPLKFMKKLHRKIEEVVTLVDANFRAQVYSFLYPRPGGPEQGPHADFTSSDVEAVKMRFSRSIPASVVVALESGTQLRVYAGCYTVAREKRSRLVDIPINYCIVFRGDVFHAGVSYSQHNYRVHCYLQFEGVSWVPYIVMSALTSSFTCQYCGYADASSNRMRDHRYICLSNPLCFHLWLRMECALHNPMIVLGDTALSTQR